jgi:hypothetical protein
MPKEVVNKGDDAILAFIRNSFLTGAGDYYIKQGGGILSTRASSPVVTFSSQDRRN